MARTAFEIPGLRFSLPTSNDIPVYRFIAVNSDGEAVLAAAAADPIVGVSQTDTRNVALRGPETLSIYRGVVIVEAGAAVNAGEFVGPDSQGRAIVASASGYSGIAMSAATAAGEQITVLFS